VQRPANNAILARIRFNAAPDFANHLPEASLNMQRRIGLLAGICLLFASTLFGQINSPTFRYVTIDFPGAASTDATGINNFGEIVGFYQTKLNCAPNACPVHGFKLVNKTFTAINIRGAISTWIFGLNDGGDVVGSFETSAHAFHGFLLHHTGQFQIIDPPAPLIGGPLAVNNSLVVVGGDFRWQGGKFTKIDFRTPNQGEDQRLNGISNSGIIVGSLFHQDFWNGVLKSGGDVDIFPRINGSDTEINGINGRGDVVGVGRIGNGGYVAFHIEAGETSTDGSERPLNPILISFPGGGQTTPHSINYQQAIVGTYLGANSTDHGFLAVH
jgi:hypothetical protein